MNIPTCYRCPERHPDPLDKKLRCPILQAKLNSVKGADLSLIVFRCEKREQLFRPGDVVTFRLYIRGSEQSSDMEGIVMSRNGRKWRIFCEDDDCERAVINLYPDGLHKTGRHHPTCVHCGRPQGKEFSVATRNDPTPHEWSCTNLRDGCEFQEEQMRLEEADRDSA